MRVFITGGTGFVGGYILYELQRRGHEVVVLVRPGSEHKLPDNFSGETVTGDVFSFKMPAGCDAVIHLIGILRQSKRKGITFERLHFQATKSVADIAFSAGVKRFLLMSANGAKPEGTPYQYTKYMAEEYIKSKGFEWTIFRPSILFGDPDYPSGRVGKSEFCTTLLNQMIRPRVPAPMFHPGLNVKQAGKFKLQPVHVRDVATGIVASLTNQHSVGKTYCIGGTEQYTWREIVDIISEAVGKKKWKIPTPAWGVKLTASLLSWFPAFPITRDQVTMLMEGNICDDVEFWRDFGGEPVVFSVENLGYLQS
ncbi:MAG: NAD-dependent epimerase/dehydratase family protein [Candidatus Marinimicrobia bacterium]|nr:NAD-dependent epimerase/dehydratase family protein [Candidatus Neomarinimicrobiota bacterium]